MERMKNIKEILLGVVQTQLGNLQEVDAEELGEVVDMIKDMEEAMYYCTITKAMTEKDKDQEHQVMYYTMPYYPNYMYDRDYYRDMDKPIGKMYYTERGGRSGTYTPSSDAEMQGRDGTSRSFRETIYEPQMRDVREGRSPIKRKMYMESKEMHHDTSKKMQELEEYMQELTTDLAEMIKDASPEEKGLLHAKISQLATKIEKANVEH